ncbi:MAG: universal stress protein, partial [Methanomicrobiaceae archaeon]|nr:universal stress protein [Methanomicrobiaceae archaeon]
MGYYSQLIRRKFKDVVGKRYEDVMREYGEFLLSEEQMIPPKVKSILMPLDIFVHEIPPELYEVLSAFTCPVSLVYITDIQTVSVIETVLDKKASDEYLRKKESHAAELLDRVTRELEAKGLDSHRRIFTGQKGEDVEKMSETHDLLLLSKSFGAERTEGYPVSPIALRISQHVKIPL